MCLRYRCAVKKVCFLFVSLIARLEMLGLSVDDDTKMLDSGSGFVLK